MIISIHASAKEATASGSLYDSDTYFNPRLREGGDHFVLDWHEKEEISIHASAKEATFLRDVRG